MRALTALVAVMVLLALLIACGKSPESPPTPPTPQASPKPVSSPVPTAQPTPAPKPPAPAGGFKLTANPVEKGTPKYGGTLGYGITGPAGFDLHRKPSWSPIYAYPAFNNLVRFNLEYFDVVADNIVGDLAEKWDVSPDGKIYTFYLVKNVKWHDGKPFTSDDVVYSIEKMMDPKRSTINDTFPAYQGVQKVDDYTVKITLKYPSPTFLISLADTYAVMQAKHTANLDNRKPEFLMGTGPFKFKSYVPESKMELVKNPEYFRKDKSGNPLPYVDGLNIFVMSGNQPLDALISKRLDMGNPAMGFQSMDQLQRAKAQATTLQYFKRTNPAPYAVYFNVRKGPLADIRVRRAITLVMKQEDLIVGRMGSIDFGDPGRGIFNPTWGIPKDEIAKLLGWDKPYDQRVAEAKRLLAEAGFAKGLNFRLVFRHTSETGEVATMTVLAEELRLIGIDSALDGLPTAEATKKRDAADFDIYSEIIYALNGDPDSFRSYFQSGQANNFMGYSNPKLDQLWEQQSRELDMAKRSAIVKDIERILLTDVPSPPTGQFVTNYHAWYPHVKNVRFINMTYSPSSKCEELWIDK